LRRLAAEFVGTFLLVFAGPGAVIVNEVSGGGVGGAALGALLYSFVREASPPEPDKEDALR
jgi:aquaporin NIP